MSLPPFEAVVDEYGTMVMRVCRAVLGADAAAEDAWSETFISALRAYPDLRPDSNVRGWLVTIAHRKAIDHHRSRTRRPTPVGDAPEVAVSDRETGTGVWTAVAGLPPKQRTAVALRFACDMPHREIAAALGGSEDAARRNLHEGLKKLREVLA